MTATKTHSYRGYEISPVQYADKAQQGYRWYIGAVHGPTGISYDSQHCTHCYTLAQAKEIINGRVRDNAAEERDEANAWSQALAGF